MQLVKMLATVHLDIKDHNFLQIIKIPVIYVTTSHIIYNWKVKFTGGSDSLSVQNFVYGVEALTNQNLGGNFELLCRYVSCLFEFKASDWFWRYHKSVREIRWPDLCNALIRQYNDFRTDIDFRELIRERKQKYTETFDHFYESILELIGRLEQPLPESSLVEILRRNLLPEIQHEILNLPIYSVSNLRDICRKRKFFVQDVYKNKHGSKPNVPRRHVAELSEDVLTSETHDDDDEVSAISFICRKTGHRYQDCVLIVTFFVIVAVGQIHTNPTVESVTVKKLSGESTEECTQSDAENSIDKHGLVCSEFVSETFVNTKTFSN